MNTNTNYADAVKHAKAIDKRAGGMWASLVLFSIGVTETNVPELKTAFKAQEKLANAEFKYQMGENSTYRVVKGRICEAVQLAVPLLDDEGKPRGKSAVEADIEAARPESTKTAFEKFKGTMSTADKIAAKLEAKDMLLALALVDELRKQLIPALEMAA